MDGISPGAVAFTLRPAGVSMVSGDRGHDYHPFACPRSASFSGHLSHSHRALEPTARAPHAIEARMWNAGTPFHRYPPHVAKHPFKAASVCGLMTRDRSGWVAYQTDPHGQAGPCKEHDDGDRRSCLCHRCGCYDTVRHRLIRGQPPSPGTCSQSYDQEQGGYQHRRRGGCAAGARVYRGHLANGLDPRPRQRRMGPPRSGSWSRWAGAVDHRATPVAFAVGPGRSSLRPGDLSTASSEQRCGDLLTSTEGRPWCSRSPGHKHLPAYDGRKNSSLSER